LTEDRPTLKPYDQDAWATLADSGTTALDESLMLLEGLHRRWVRVFESLRETGSAPGGTPKPAR
jgi:hypothetical protein